MKEREDLRQEEATLQTKLNDLESILGQIAVIDQAESDEKTGKRDSDSA